MNKLKSVIQRNKVIVGFGILMAILFGVAIFYGEQEGGFTKLAPITIVTEKLTGSKTSENASKEGDQAGGRSEPGVFPMEHPHEIQKECGYPEHGGNLSCLW